MTADTHVLPEEIDKIFRRVQDSAHYMPDWQMEVYNPFPECRYIGLLAVRKLCKHH